MSGWKEIAITKSLEEVKDIFERMGADVREYEFPPQDDEEEANQDRVKLSLVETENNVVVFMGGYDHPAYPEIIKVLLPTKPAMLIAFDGNDTSDTGSWQGFEKDYKGNMRETISKAGEQKLGGWNWDVSTIIRERYNIDIVSQEVREKQPEYLVVFEDKEDMRKGFNKFRVSELI